MKISIIGQGFVGGALSELFKPLNPVKYDPFKGFKTTKEEVNETDISFICVGTPMKKDKTYDLSSIHEVFSWLKTKVAVIKSTVPPMTCKILQEKYPNIKIVHNPEFLREVSAIEDMKNANRTIIAGDMDACEKVVEVYKNVYGSEMIYQFTDTTTSEMLKYINNCYLSAKVAFCNEIYDICKHFGVSYNVVRELWLLDKRVTRSHTTVTEERGFGGHCFPKDLNALIKKCDELGYNPKLLKDIWNHNCRVREEFKGKEYND